jgi:hypothetical protein
LVYSAHRSTGDGGKSRLEFFILSSF